MVTNMSLAHYATTALPILEQACEALNEEFIYQEKTHFAADAFIFHELRSLAGPGKRLRGLLTILSCGAFGQLDEESYEIAALVEYAHLALLIHDDVMDKSVIRRGTLSAPGRYAAILDGRGIIDSDDQGAAVSIALGDLLFFFILQKITNLSTEDFEQQPLTELFLRTLAYTARGQIFDMVAGMTKNKHEDIVKLYETKTGYYSFFLPLAVGAHQAGLDSEEIDLLEILGKYLGLIFQIKDDQAGLKNDYQDLTSDIAQNKATLWRWLLEQETSGRDKEHLAALFGAPIILREDITFIKSLVESHHIHEKVNQELTSYAKEAHAVVHCLPIPRDKRKLLHEFINSL